MKTRYLILLGLFVFFTIGFCFFEDRILFFCYGFPQKLISAQTPDTYKAYDSIDTGRLVFYLITLVTSILFSIHSVKGYRKSIGTKRIVFAILMDIGIAITLVLVLMLVISIVMANIGGGMLG